MGGADASTITVLFVQVNMIVKKYQIMDIDMMPTLERDVMIGGMGLYRSIDEKGFHRQMTKRWCCTIVIHETYGGLAYLKQTNNV